MTWVVTTFDHFQTNSKFLTAILDFNKSQAVKCCAPRGNCNLRVMLTHINRQKESILNFPLYHINSSWLLHHILYSCACVYNCFSLLSPDYQTSQSLDTCDFTAYIYNLRCEQRRVCSATQTNQSSYLLANTLPSLLLSSSYYHTNLRIRLEICHQCPVLLLVCKVAVVTIYSVVQ